jgi:hypothetical protein
MTGSRNCTTNFFGSFHIEVGEYLSDGVRSLFYATDSDRQIDTRRSLLISQKSFNNFTDTSDILTYNVAM